MFIPIGLSVYALGLAAASRYFFGETLVYGYHPGLIYTICLLLSLCFCPLGRQAPYARFYAGLASFFTTITAAVTTFLYLFAKRNKERYPWLILLLLIGLGIPLLVLAILSPVLLFAYHLALARARKPFWVLALQANIFFALCAFRVYAVYHSQYELVAFQAFGYWMASYSLVLLTLALSYFRNPYKLQPA